MKIKFKPISKDYRKSQEFTLSDDNDRITVGRKEDNDFSIPLRNVSSYHAVIQFKDNTLILEDLNSTNGVFINNKKIEGSQVIDHTTGTISFATVDFMVEIQSESYKQSIPQVDREPKQEPVFVAPVPEKNQNNDSINDTQQHHVPQSNAQDQQGSGTMLFGMKNVLQLGRLVRLDNSGTMLQEYNLDEDITSIGREQCTIILDHASISRHHATIEKKGTEYTVEDNNSTNGTQINGKHINKKHLLHEDHVTFGDIEFIYLAPGKIFSKSSIEKGRSTGNGFNKKILYGGLAAVLLTIIILLALIPSSDSGTTGKKTRLTEQEIIKQIDISYENEAWDEVVDLIESFNVTGKESVLEKSKMEIENRTIYETMIERIDNNQYPDALNILKTINSESSYYKKAEDYYQKASDSYVSKMEEKAAELMNSGDYDESTAVSKELTELFPGNQDIATFHEQNVKNAENLKSRAKQRAYYTRMRRKAESDAKIHSENARSLYLNGKLIDALTELENSQKIYSKNNLPVPGKLANTQKNMQRLRTNYNNGKNLILQGRTDEASAYFLKVFELSDSLYGTEGAIEKECGKLMVEYFSKQSEQAFKSGNFVKAYGFIDRILKVDPSNRQALSMKRDISDKANQLYRNGYIEQTQYKNNKQALFYFKQVLELIPNTDPLYKKAEKRIAECEK